MAAKRETKGGGTRARAKGTGKKKATNAKPRRSRKAAEKPLTPPRGIGQTAHGRMLQGTYIGIRKKQGATLPAIAKELGVSRATVDRIHKDTEGADFSELLRRKPAEIVEWLVGQREQNVALFTLAALQAETGAELVGALKGRDRAIEGLTDLLQETRFLPRNLGTVRHEIDLRQLGEHLVVLVAAVGSGKLPLEELPRMFQKLTNVEIPPVVDGDRVKEVLELAG